MRWRFFAILFTSLAAAYLAYVIFWPKPPKPSRQSFASGEILVRAPIAPIVIAGVPLIDRLTHLFDQPLDTCCAINSRRTYRFNTQGRTVQNAIQEARQIHPLVWAQPNFIYMEDLRPNDGEFGKQWSLDAPGDVDLNMPEAWDGVTGDSRVEIAIVDSGVAYQHDELRHRMWRNEIECPNSTTGTTLVDDDHNGYIDDCYGIDTQATPNGGNLPNVPAGDPNAVANDHGTAVAGIAAAHGSNAFLMSGVVWDSRVVACKFYESPFGGGTTFDLEECLTYLVKLKKAGTAPGLAAVNVSWGTNLHDDIVFCAIDALRQEEVLVVAAAGNIGYDIGESPHYPASYFLPNVIAVAESDANDTILSSFGERSVHIASPGGVASLGLGNKLKAFGGSSGAAPHVTGLIALLEADDRQDGNDDLKWHDLKNRVIAGGVRRPTLEGKIISGRRLRAWDREIPPEGGVQVSTRAGALTCHEQVVQRRLRPLENHTNTSTNGRELLVAAGKPIFIAALSIDCATPLGPVEVMAVDSNGPTVVTIPLDDANTDYFQADDDGVFTAKWTPPASFTDFVLKFRYDTAAAPVNADSVTVHVVSNPPPGEQLQQLQCQKQP